MDIALHVAHRRLLLAVYCLPHIVKLLPSFGRPKPMMCLIRKHTVPPCMVAYAEHRCRYCVVDFVVNKWQLLGDDRRPEQPAAFGAEHFRLDYIFVGLENSEGFRKLEFGQYSDD